MDTRRYPKFFYHCTMSEKLLFTCFLLIIGLGYLMALTYLFLSHQNYDSKPGVSYEDIVYSYYGNRSGTILESAIRGNMAGYLTMVERNKMVDWLKNGQTKEKFEAQVQPTLKNNCVSCHNPTSGLKIPDLTSYEKVLEVSKVDKGASIFTLVKLSHIHLFGVGLFLFCVGFIFRYAVLPGWIKYPLIVIPFLAIISDITAWYVTKWDPHYATVVVISGGALGLALGCQILISLVQIWFLREPKEE